MNQFLWKSLYLISSKSNNIKIKEDAFKIPQVLSDEASELLNVQNLYEQFEATTKDWYIAKLTTMLHLEEAEAMKSLAEYDFQEVQLSLKSRDDKTFSINVITIFE